MPPNVTLVPEDVGLGTVAGQRGRAGAGRARDVVRAEGAAGQRGEQETSGEQPGGEPGGVRHRGHAPSVGRAASLRSGTPGRLSRRRPWRPVAGPSARRGTTVRWMVTSVSPEAAEGDLVVGAQLHRWPRRGRGPCRSAARGTRPAARAGRRRRWSPAPSAGCPRRARTPRGRACARPAPAGRRRRAAAPASGRGPARSPAAPAAPRRPRRGSRPVWTSTSVAGVVVPGALVGGEPGIGDADDPDAGDGDAPSPPAPWRSAGRRSAPAVAAESWLPRM